MTATRPTALNRSPLADRPKDSVLYLTGSSGPAVRAAARGREDLGVMVTPMRPDYLTHTADYPAGFALDNGAFSKGGFDAEGFRELAARVAWSADLADRCLFAVAPDVVGDPHKTLALALEWLPWVRSLGLPAAFVLQDGCETGDLIPWGEFDVLFVGGSTGWKIGAKRIPGGWQYPPTQREWMRIFRDAGDRGIPVHMGRVNSWERIEIAYYGLGCVSADGTYLGYGPDTNLPKLLGWLDRANRPRS